MYQLRIASERAQVETAPDTSLAWYSPNLMEERLPATTVPNLGSGVWYWQVRAMDAQGNKSTWSDVWTVAIDASRPVIKIARPLEGELLGHTAIPFRADISDASELASVVVELDGHDITAQVQQAQTEAGMQLQRDWQAKELSDGNHTIRILATNIHEHTSEAVRSFIVDTTPPEITTTIEDEQILKGVASLDLTANEASVYATRIMANGHEILAQDDVEPQKEGMRYVRAWNTLGVSDGKYTIIFAARDVAGNESTVARQVMVVNTPAVGIIITKDPLSEELSANLSQPLATPQFTAQMPRVAPSAPPESSDDICHPYDELLSVVPEFTPVVATENGWRLFGILWYWSMLGGLLLAGGASYAWRSVRTPIQQIPDSV